MGDHRRILIVGGYGAFGLRAVERLARESDLDIVVAGRSIDRATAAAEAIQPVAAARLSAAAIDAARPDAAALADLAPHVIVNASGPFQTADRSLARAAVAVGAHYVDLADARDFVVAFAADEALDRQARARDVLAVAGASTVPAISAAVIDHYSPRFSCLKAVRYGLSPGNRFDPGPATTASVLGGVGRAFETRRGGRQTTVHGWQGATRHRFRSIGRRWLGYCNVPDLALFPTRYPTLETIEFRAGVEVSAYHLGLWVLSWAVRARLVPHPQVLAKPLSQIKRRLAGLGSDAGGMFVELAGDDVRGAPQRILWELEALNGHGPYIPTTPAVVLARRLARGEIAARGAHACVGLVTLGDIERELADLDIRSAIR